MKKMLIILGVFFMLTGCRYRDFEYGSPVIKNESDYDAILDMVMEKGNYNDNTEAPYSRLVFAFDYNNGVQKVDVLNVSVFRSYNGEETTYDTTDCFDVEGELKCREYKSTTEGERILPEIKLKVAYQHFANVDIDEVLFEVKNQFEVRNQEEVYFIYKFILPEEITKATEHADGVLYYRDEEYSSTNFEPTDMVLHIKVIFFYEGSGLSYSLVKEIE